MKASQQAIERGVKDCLFVDFKRRSGHFDVTTVASIKEITEKVLVALDQGMGTCLSPELEPLVYFCVSGPCTFAPLPCVSLRPHELARVLLT